MTRRWSSSPANPSRSSARAKRAHECWPPIPIWWAKWATWEHFRELEARGLMMYGQYTAGTWAYIGTQGILQGTFETFAAAGARTKSGTLAGHIVLTAGLGGMGGAQPLAVKMAGGVCVAVEVDRARAQRRFAGRLLRSHRRRPVGGREACAEGGRGEGAARHRAHRQRGATVRTAARARPRVRPR